MQACHGRLFTTTSAAEFNPINQIDYFLFFKLVEVHELCNANNVNNRRCVLNAVLSGNFLQKCRTKIPITLG